MVDVGGGVWCQHNENDPYSQFVRLTPRQKLKESFQWIKKGTNGSSSVSVEVHLLIKDP